MISDMQLNAMALGFGFLMVTLIVCYHAVDSTFVKKLK
ncbi:hypothetical protein NCAS_0G01540 [Naumovozyma castellii]|uniref:Uncharacterized protein n=1 Tax=Naumovozyma castellii TaxID=27288 RepID=G0VI07_NAUCA|nr:hypothetical protein NCAS_0G01540 [Naumovozyma castellii CBS 4309]CCC71041.1 hypothetical protein NCAS_0G01540 [Naumovozyma castellii CBS 4309]